MERASECVLALPNAQRLPGQLVHLKSTADADEIVWMQTRRRLRVDGAQASMQCGAALLFGDAAVPVPNLSVACRCTREPEEQCLDPQERAATHDGNSATGANCLDALRCTLR